MKKIPSLILLGLFLCAAFAFQKNPPDKLSSVPDAKKEAVWDEQYPVTSQETWIHTKQEATAYAIKLPTGSHVYFQPRGGEWVEGQPEEADPETAMIPDAPDFDPNAEEWSMLTFSDAPFQDFRFRVETPAGKTPPPVVQFSFYDPRIYTPYRLASLTLPASDGPVKIISRAEWGADESYRYTQDTVNTTDTNAGEESEVGTQRIAGCDNLQNVYPDEFEINKVVTKQDGHTLRWPFQYSTSIDKIVLHHTAAVYTYDHDPEEVLRGIYSYHARTRGWGDIGYHYVIDPFGNIYQGRAGGDYVVGGHVYCSNIHTIGISLMGNFQQDQPTPDQLNAVMKLLPVLADKYNLDLTASSVFHGKNMPNLLGHRDLGPTSCPGENFYGLLGDLRAALKNSAVIKRLADIKRSATFLGKINVLQFLPGDKKQVLYQFKNTGNVKWTPQNSWLYVVKPLDGISIVSRDAKKTYVAGLLREKEVAPGQTATFAVDITSSLKTGLQSLEFTPVVQDRKVSDAAVVQPVDVTQPQFGAVLQTFSTPVPPAADQEIPLTVVLKNVGTVSWDKNNTNLSLRINGKTYVGSLDESTTQSLKLAKFRFHLDPLPANAYPVTVDLLQNGTRIAEMPTLFFSLSVRRPDYRIKLLTPALSKIKADTQGNAITTIKFSNLGNVDLPQKNLTLVVTGQGKTLNFPLNEGVVAVRTSGSFTVNIPMGTARLARFNFAIKGNGITLPVVSGVLLVTSALTPAPNTTPIPAPSNTANTIRLRLSIPDTDTVKILSTKNADVLIDGQKAGSITGGDSTGSSVAKSGNSVTLNNPSKNGSLLRIVPQDKDNIVTIASWDRTPSWDTAKKYHDNTFRGTLEIRVYNGKLTVINELPLEDYLKGLAEVSDDAPTEKQKVMAIIARTYAAFYLDPQNRKFPGAPYDGDDSPDTFQKYLGYDYERRSPNFIAAVNATTGKVVKYQGKLIKTPYFSQSDGRTRSAEEVWGWKDTPYLQSVADPYSAGLTLQGHGVGLSGKGAEGAAKAGKKFEEIIKYYYQGVEIESL